MRRACSGSRPRAAAASRALAPSDRDLDTLFPSLTALAARRRARGRRRRAVRSRRVARSRARGSSSVLLPLLALCVPPRLDLRVAARRRSRRCRAPRRSSGRILWQRPDQRGCEALRGAASRSARPSCSRIRSGAAPRSIAPEQFEASAASLANIDSAEGHYNRGNALAKAGQLPAAIARLRPRARARSRARGRALQSRSRRGVSEDNPEEQPAAGSSRASRASKATRTNRRARAASSRTAASRPTSSRASKGSKARTARAKPNDGSQDQPEQPNDGEQQAEEELGAGTRTRAKKPPTRRPRKRNGARGRRAVGVGAGRGAVVAPRAARPGRLAAAQVPVSVPAFRRRSGRQSRGRRLGRGAASRGDDAPARAVGARVRVARARRRAARRSRKTRPCRRPSIAPSCATTSRSRTCLRAEGAVRGEPEIAPLAAQFDVLEHARAAAHRHRQRRGRPRSTSGSTS